MLAACITLCISMGCIEPIDLDIHARHRRTSIGYARPALQSELIEAPASMEIIEGNACAEGTEVIPCIFEPGESGLAKVELTAGEKARLVLKSKRGSTNLPIRSGNTLLLNIPADATLSLVGGKDEPVQVHWTFRPRH